jgi:putative DNA primase/helicase
VATRRKTRSEPRYRLTDVGNSLRFTEDHWGRLIYVPGPGWHGWDGMRWRLDNESAPYRAAKETAHRLRLEASEIDDPALADGVFRWATNSESRARIDSMVDLARRGERTTRGLLLPLDELDAHSHLLTCSNGVVNLKTGRSRGHIPDDYLTRLVKLDYDPKAKAPRWAEFLNEVFDGNAELIAYVQRAVGYSLTGETREQTMFIAHGSGANGKSVFMETVAAAAGEYAATAASDTFVSARRDAIPNDLARFRGARLVRVPETEDGAGLARQVIKRITGGDSIAARFLHREWFEYYPTFKVWLVTNHLPSIPHNDLATWRRIRVVPFDNTIPGSKRDPRLASKLRAELPGILAWAAAGARAWYKEGLGYGPEVARKATQDYRARQDTVGRFLDEETEYDSEARTLNTALYDGYLAWCRSEGQQPISRTALNKALRERGYGEAKVGAGDRVFLGVRLR